MSDVGKVHLFSSTDPSEFYLYSQAPLHQMHVSGRLKRMDPTEFTFNNSRRRMSFKDTKNNKYDTKVSAQPMR